MWKNSDVLLHHRGGGKVNFNCDICVILVILFVCKDQLSRMSDQIYLSY